MKLLRREFLGLFASALAAKAARAEPSVYPTGVTRYDPAKAYGTFISFGGADDITHLTDMDGNEVHRWNYPGQPSGILDPALSGGQRGHVVVQLSMMDQNDPAMFKGLPFYLHDKSIGELDWNGNVVWQWGANAPDGAALQHHDWARLPNGNTLVLSVLERPLLGFALPKLVDNVIYEVTPKGDIVWRWMVGDHLDEIGWTPNELALVRATKRTYYLTINAMKPLGPNHWSIAGDARFDPDNIIISSRDANFVVIIDKKLGKIVWRLGPDYPRA